MNGARSDNPPLGLSDHNGDMETRPNRRVCAEP